LLLTIQADSSSTVEDLVNKGELNQRDLNEICLSARMVPPNFTPDLTRFTANSAINLSYIRAALIRHSRPAEPNRPVIPSPAANYTGIIIIADQPLPIRGRNTSALLKPCLFPKIWDTEMNLIYEKNMTDPSLTGSGINNPVHYTKTESIYNLTPSGLTDDLIKLVGDRPLRIFATSVFGTVPTDPVIDKNDALLILSAENNRRLLREGKVVFVINESMLKKTLP